MVFHLPLYKAFAIKTSLRNIKIPFLYTTFILIIFFSVSLVQKIKIKKKERTRKKKNVKIQSFSRLDKRNRRK